MEESLSLSPLASRPRLLGAAIAATAALALGAPSGASASTTTCSGHLEKGEETTQLVYEFGCSDKIIGYTLTFDQQIDGFEPEVPVLDPEGNATNELMSCEGDFPSFGVGCFGAYSAGGRNIHGTVDAARAACASPRYKAWLFVITGAKGQTGGPFALRGPQGCGTHVSAIQRLLDWIKLLRKEAARK
jgi:hypothetical protein